MIVYCKANPDQLIIEAIAVVFKDMRARLGIEMKPWDLIPASRLVSGGDILVESCDRGSQMMVCHCSEVLPAGS